MLRLDPSDQSPVLAVTQDKLTAISRTQRSKGRRRAQDEILSLLGFRTLADLATFVAAARGALQ